MCGTSHRCGTILPRPSLLQRKRLFAMIAAALRPRLAGTALAVLLAALPPATQAQPDFGDNSSQWANDGECDDPRFEGEGAAETLLAEDRGHDAADCRMLFDAGRIVLRTAAGNAIDYGDDDSEWARDGECDDPRFEGDGMAATLLDADAYHDATDCRTLVEDGRIALRDTVALATRLERAGRLEAGDTTLSSGEFYDSFEFEGAAGQHVAIDLRSAAFDTYLILQDPAGEQSENDDAEDGGEVGHSSLEAELTEAGTYRVLVTSYETGESGAYTLTIDPSTAARRSAPAARDVPTLTTDSAVGGELATDDPTFEAGEYHDTYEFDGVAGETVRLELASTDFDTYLGIVTPSGEELANDDFQGATDRSVIELKLPESGSYRVQATSYAAAETGRYRLTLTTGAPEVPAERRSAGRVYGLFAGISDYQPPNTDLDYTVEDATRIRDALLDGGGMRADDAYTLVDEEATVANVTAAIRDIARRMSPDDTFVMFYSGHGGQIARSDGPTASDPDAMDETLTLYDGDLLDDELRALFDEIDRGTVLLWLDSCFSGGFAKDIVSAPGRMGIFSSEEDITSNVASKFRAGGYLSHFLDEAIAQGLADDDGDRSITAIELSQYLHERYRADVKSTQRAVVRTEMTLGYQHLVVDRGSIGAYDVLFAR
jgi:hypothetical protein